MKITFLGATGTVTGSRYLIEHAGKKILIDCGLFQGHKELRLRNWEPFPVDPKSIYAVILTHAHLDHTGYIPRLVKGGFKGKIFCSLPTKELSSILLPDSGYLQEEDARLYNKWHVSKHKPALPLYTEKEAEQSLAQFKSVEFGKTYVLFGDLSFVLHRMGHILGASCVMLKDDTTSILFSGDIGRMNDPIMNPPTQIPEADYLVVESTYGNRRHLDEEDPMICLEKIIHKTINRGGTLVIPSFAVGRAQTLLYYIWKLKTAKRIPVEIPVFLDSPMAIEASQLFCKYANEHRLTRQQAEKVCAVASYVKTSEESKALDHIGKPCIIISASGMATGGRVLHHIKHFVGDAKNTILFAGYQAGGTRGDKLIRGIGEIKMFGQLYPVKAEIKQLHNISAHADYEEITEWLGYFQTPPRKVFITHGEMDSAEAMKKVIEDHFGWPCIVPEFKHTEEL
jgi:metallo-beta-lactamase family protein